ncbi:MAG: LysM peptidoglycan-binding domain-containing protein [Pirellulales bacterium]
MNSLKTMMVVTVMGVVAYGVYATLTKAPPAPGSEEDSIGPSVEMPMEAMATSTSASSETSFAPKFLPTEPAESAPRYGGQATATDGYAPDVELPDPLDSTYDPPAYEGPADLETVPSEAYASAADALPEEVPPDVALPADAEVVAATAVSSDPAAAGPSEFEVAVNHVYELLDQNKLADALRALTPWYDSKLPTNQQAEVVKLLDQLAGTVVYSREHLLVPAYVVQAGETLPDIATRYNVPWQLLAKINGISSPTQVQAGETLKVVPGPFSAVVDGSRYRLTLYVAGCYAGRFQIGLPNEQEAPSQRYEVQDKIDNPTYTTADGREFKADDPQNPVGEHWLELGDGLGIHGTTSPETIGRETAEGGVRLNAIDAHNVFDILSIGSQVLIRR